VRRRLEFHARLAATSREGSPHPERDRRPIGSRLRIASDGERRDATATPSDAHVLEGRSGVSVRFLRPPGPEEPTPVGAEDLVTDDPPGPPPIPVAAQADSLGASAEIMAAANHHVARLLRSVAALSALALVLAAAGYAIGLRLAKRSPAVVAAAHLASADRLLAQGRVLGKDGALEQLLAAREVRPEDAVVTARLTRMAALLESLGARAIDRGDLAVASVHLRPPAALADPMRESVRAKRAYLAAREQAGEARQRPRASRQRR
jgi:hypothetical protein